MLIKPICKDTISGFTKKPINGTTPNLIENRTKIQENCTEYDHKSIQPRIPFPKLDTSKKLGEK